MENPNVTIGRAQQYLESLLKYSIFDDLSKHSDQWHSVHDREGELLNELRMRLSCLNDDMWNLMAILKQDV